MPLFLSHCKSHISSYLKEIISMTSPLLTFLRAGYSGELFFYFSHCLTQYIVSQNRYSIAVYWISEWVMNGWMNEWMTKLFLTLRFLSAGGHKTHPRVSAYSFCAHGKSSKMLVVWKKAYLTETKWASGGARVFYQPRVQFMGAGSNGIQEACMFCWL